MLVHKKTIVDGLRDSGLKIGDIILVHSSLSKFGYVEGGIDTVIDALIETVGSQGTVVVPTLTGSKELSPENPPVFNVKETPCWTGKIPETFRKRKEAIRSLHPTHSVASIGAKAKFITEKHQKCLMPCDQNSPYYKIAELGGYILFLGVTLDSCTTMHTIEEIAKLNYHMQKKLVEAKIIDYDGREKTVKIMIHQYGILRNFRKLEEDYIKMGIMKKGKIGKAEICLIKSKEMIDYTLKTLQKNPQILVAPSGTPVVAG